MQDISFLLNAVKVYLVGNIFFIFVPKARRVLPRPLPPAMYGGSDDPPQGCATPREGGGQIATGFRKKNEKMFPTK